MEPYGFILDGEPRQAAVAFDVLQVGLSESVWSGDQAHTDIQDLYTHQPAADGQGG